MGFQRQLWSLRVVGFRFWKEMESVVLDHSGSKVFALGTATITTTSNGEGGEQQKGVGSGEESYGSSRELSTLCREGRLKEAVKFLDTMDQGDIRAYSDAYASILQGCAKMKALEDGKQVHAHIIRSGYGSDFSLGNTLVSMYSKCGSILDARQVFDNMSERNVISWTAMISGYAQEGYGKEAFELFKEMQRAGVNPDKVTFISILNACTVPAALQQGKQVHAQIINAGFESDVHLGNAIVTMYARCGDVTSAQQVFDKMPERDVVSWTTLVNMYCKCGNLVNARQVFDEMPKRDVVSWTAMIAGYAQQGHSEMAFQLFRQMQQEGVRPDKVTFLSILNACASPGALQQGKQVHGHIINARFESDVRLGNALVSMYAKCGSVDSARRVFDKMFKRDVVSWTALVDMYCKCGSVKDARQVFDQMPKRDVVSWNAMISGYAQRGHGEEVFELVQQMHGEGLKPDSVTFIGILNACSSQAALEEGKRVHGRIIESGFESDVSVGNALVDMYSKCRSVVDARQVFDRIPKRDVVSWNAMITGYTQNGYGTEALQLFKQMQWEDVKPDNITFIGVLTACSQLGLVDEARQYFRSMSQDHGITPTWKHHGYMAQLVGPSGCLEEVDTLLT